MALPCGTGFRKPNLTFRPYGLQSLARVMAMLEPLDPDALMLAAERTGLSQKQVADALIAFRLVNSKMAEPEWRSVSHITMRDCAIGRWEGEGTGVALEMFTPRKDDGSFGKAVKSYVFGGKEYETFGEARFAEFRAISAQAIEAGTAKTEWLGAQHESAVHAPKPNQEPTNG